MTADGRMLYRDGNHLSSTGARYLIDAMEPELERLLWQRRRADG